MYGPYLPLLAKIQGVQQVAAGFGEFLVAQDAKVRHRKCQRRRLRQKKVADGGVREAREIFELLERGLSFATEPQGPLVEAPSQVAVVKARAFRCPAKHGHGSSHGRHASSLGNGASAMSITPAASSLTVIGG